MPDLETCRRNILSEDYRDFIENRTRTPLFNELLLQNPCEQDAGSGYTCYYFPKESVEPITLSRFSYNSIPQCFSPLSMETLNQAGILPVQNYPTLQLKGQGVLIGFLDRPGRAGGGGGLRRGLHAPGFSKRGWHHKNSFHLGSDDPERNAPAGICLRNGIYPGNYQCRPFF